MCPDLLSCPPSFLPLALSSPQLHFLSTNNLNYLYGTIVPKLVTGNLEKGKRAIWKKEKFFSFARNFT